MANSLTSTLKEIVGETLFFTQWTGKQKLDKFPESPQKSYLLDWAPFLQSILCLEMNHISLPAIQEKYIYLEISFVEICCGKNFFSGSLFINLENTLVFWCCWFLSVFDYVGQCCLYFTSSKEHDRGSFSVHIHQHMYVYAYILYI